MRNTCTIEGCEAYVVGQGLCRKHYMRKYRTGVTSDVRKNARGICSVEGCDRPHQALGLCHGHWKSQRDKRKRAERALPLRCHNCGVEFTGRRRRNPDGPAFCSRACKDKSSWTKGRLAAAALDRKYGLTREQVNAMAARGCHICGTTEWKSRSGRPDVDHCHGTGRVRGVLCHRCNVGLGWFKDDPDWLRKAAAYLERALT